MAQLRRVAIVGGNRIPFARSNTVYATACNQDMLTSALDGLVERFNGRIAEITAQTRFHSAAELEQTLMNYVKVYNTRIPQRALDHHTPLDALKSWRAKSPDLFKKRPKNLPGLDS